MNILFSLALLIHFSTHFHGHCIPDNLQLGKQLIVAIPPAPYMKGFATPAFLLETSQPVPSFRAGLTVEAIEEKYLCSLNVFLGDFKVWSSSLLSRFFTTDKCVIGLTSDGDLQLTGQNGEVGWQTATQGQGIKRLQLSDNGNLVLVDEFNITKWQSFHYPTNVMLWGQTLSVGTKLTSPSTNSNYSFEIHREKLALYLNSDMYKYLYWEFNPKKPENISFIRLAINGLLLFNNKSHKIAQIPCKRLKFLRFLAIDNATGNLGFYYYSNTTHKFEATSQALKSKCDQPNTCKVDEICSFPNKCSNLQIKGSMGNFCESSRVYMKEIRDETSVLRDENRKIVNATKESCAGACIKNCTCVGALFISQNRECYLYGETRGMKKLNNVGETSFMVKVLGDKNGNGLKKWELILIVVVDGIVLFVCLGGMGFYMLWKRKNEASND